jgi:pyruvate/2-oxoglutarate dehydrogenase complex dihydrolipoamide acyltransferase (E2) component
VKEKVFDIQRRVVAHKTVESWQTIPHAGLVIDLDVTEVLSFVDALRQKEEYRDIRITMNSVILKIIAESIKESPEINSSISYSNKNGSGKVLYRDSIDIAVPMVTKEKRMITPIVRNLDRLSLPDVCRAMDELKRRANNTPIDLLLVEVSLLDTKERFFKGQFLSILRRIWANFFSAQRISMPPLKERRRFARVPLTERLGPADLLDATTLVSNGGTLVPGLPCHCVLLEIIPPQITAMGLTGIQRKPMVMKNEAGEESVAIRSIMPMTFYIDHRALDFEHVVGFLHRLHGLCAEPEELITL